MAKVKISFEFTSTASVEVDVDEKTIPSGMTVGAAAEAYVKATIDVGRGHKLPWFIEGDPFAKRGYRSFEREEVYDADAVIEPPPASITNPGPLIPPSKTLGDADEIAF